MHRRDWFRTVAFSASAAGLESAPARIAVISGEGALERLAANELSGFLGKLFGSKFPVVAPEALGASGFRIGAGAGIRPFLAEGRRERFDALPEDGYLLVTSGASPARVLTLAAKTPPAALYAVYDLLERYGVRFFLSGDEMPERRQPFSVLPLDETVRPAFRLRGALPWFNFMMGPTSWSLADYKSYIDQLLKLRYNYLAFHFYSHEPFLSFRYKGVSYPTGYQSHQHGHPAIWPSQRIQVGRQHLPPEYFGMPGGPAPELAIPRLQQALEYARSRGFKTNVGLELSVVPVVPSAIPDEDFVGGRPAVASEVSHLSVNNLDPTSKSAEQITRARLEALVRTYPGTDWFTIWYSEHFQYRELPVEKLSAGLRAYHDAHLKKFSYDQWHFSPTSYVVFLCWIELAHRILKELKPDAKMAIAGWSIDSMFTGARDVLPKDIAFASLSGYEPQWALRANVIDRFWKGVAGRERHYVSWWEFDGRCLGLPQPKVRSFDHLLTDMHAAGMDAAVFLHWRTRILDGNARYTSLRCWRNDLRPEEFYRDYARAKFGEQAGPLCVEALLALEDYDQWQLADRGTYLSNVAYDYGVLPDPIYRLTQALGIPFGSQGREPEGDVRQTIKALTSPREKPVPRTDEEVFQPGESGHGLAEAIQRLRRIRESLRPAERVARGARAQANLRYLTGRIEYYQQYLAFYGSIMEVYLTLTRDPAQPLKDRLQRAASILKSVDVNRLVAKYAEHIGNSGERGVLVSLNRKLIEPVQAITARVELLQKT